MPCIQCRYQPGIINKNGNYFTKECLEKSFNEYIEKYGKMRTGLGGLGLPDPTVDTAHCIRFDRVACLAESIEIKDDKYYWNIKVLETPLGKTLQSILDELGEDSCRIDLRGYVSEPEKDGKIGKLDILSFAVIPNEERKKE